MALAYACSANAGVVFTLGNNPQPEEENILLPAGDTGTEIIGTTNQTFLDVSFTSTQTLVVPTSGQLRITGDGVPLTNVSIALGDDGTFGDYIFNPSIVFSTCSGCGGTATVSVASVLNGVNEAASTFSYTLSNGQNFLTITTLGGESIRSISISAPNGFSSLSQSLISGPFTSGTSAVPEPGTLLLCAIGLASIGFAARSRAIA